ncbi:MAG: hypothetical protein H7A19_10455 [Rhodanobacteraceae bacterium]|nr:hypothetical protein [Rhodanobacteraceae bacterium]
MATKDDTTSKAEAELDAVPRFTTEVLAPFDVMYQRLAQARAFSLLLTGEGFDHFTQFPPGVQHDALAALDSLLDDAAVAASRASADSARGVHRDWAPVHPLASPHGRPRAGVGRG